MKFLFLQQHDGYGGILSKICQRNTNIVLYYLLWNLKKIQQISEYNKNIRRFTDT